MTQNRSQVRIVGLTGSIATGKSTVSSMLKEKGIPVIDADSMVRQLSLKGGVVWTAILKAFGSDYFLPDGTLNRKALGQAVFTDPAALKKLNAVTHPSIVEAIFTKIDQMIEHGYDGLIVVDAPVLIESGLHARMDEIWLVMTDEALQLERLIKRDGLTTAEALQRIQSQMHQTEKAKYAHRILCNDLDEAHLLCQVEKLLAAYELGRSRNG